MPYLLEVLYEDDDLVNLLWLDFVFNCLFS